MDHASHLKSGHERTTSRLLFRNRASAARQPNQQSTWQGPPARLIGWGPQSSASPSSGALLPWNPCAEVPWAAAGPTVLSSTRVPPLPENLVDRLLQGSHSRSQSTRRPRPTNVRVTKRLVVPIFVIESKFPAVEDAGDCNAKTEQLRQKCLSRHQRPAPRSSGERKGARSPQTPRKKPWDRR